MDNGGSSRSAKRKVGHVTLGTRLRTYFLAGILITAPVSLTIYLAWLFVSYVDNQVFALLPAKYNPETYLPFSVPGIGLILIVVGLTMVGALTAGLLGRMLRQSMDAILNRLPIIRSLYSAIKQIMETVLANQSAAFREVVLLEYPRKGIWTIGFITGNTAGEIRSHVPEDATSVFVPTTPNPTSGFLLFVPTKDLVRLKMSVEAGIKLVVSGGLVAPGEKELSRPKAPLPAAVGVSRSAGS
jgi:uncharacterized membrane protein